MDIQLLKYLGNIDQIASIREYQLLRGRGEQIQVAEFYNAAGLRFTVIPDRCMDLFDLSYKGVNLSFQSKNGLVAPQANSAAKGEFTEQWSGGMLVTCGLDNVGGYCEQGGIFPAHGRISSVPAKNFGTACYWEEEKYILRAQGETHQTRLYGRHLSINRTIETELNSKSLKIHDVLTNYDAKDEPYMLLYHINFGYPLLQEDTCVEFSRTDVQPMNDLSKDWNHMMKPEDGRGQEMFFHTNMGERAVGIVYNNRLELGAYVAFDTENLPNLMQWKMMKSHDYVLALEPCNTYGMNRQKAGEEGKLAVLPAYSKIENHLELGVLEGLSDIRQFLKNL